MQPALFQVGSCVRTGSFAPFRSASCLRCGGPTTYLFCTSSQTYLALVVSRWMVVLATGCTYSGSVPSLCWLRRPGLLWFFSTAHSITHVRSVDNPIRVSFLMVNLVGRKMEECFKREFCEHETCVRVHTGWLFFSIGESSCKCPSWDLQRASCGYHHPCLVTGRIWMSWDWLCRLPNLTRASGDIPPFCTR